MNEVNEVNEPNSPWYAIKLFTLRQNDVANYFKEKGLEVFIPMEHADIEDDNHKVHHILRPVVRNLIFVKKSIEEKDFKQLVTDCQYKIAVITRNRNSREYAEIPAKQMEEFQIMCNPDLAMTKYISTDEARLKKGTTVIVTNGPLKGLTGRLVRQNKLYYLLKEVPGLAILLKVSRWCCKAYADGMLNDK